MRRFVILLALALIPALLLGCPPELPDEQPPPPGQAYLLRISSCPDLKDHVAEAWTESLVRSRYGNYYGGWLEDDSDGDAGGEPSGNDEPSDYSDTNVQEEGVDEPDLVKTDGEYIYVAQRGELTVLDSWPPEETSKVASLELDEAEPFSMFLLEDRILLYSQAWNPFGNAGDDHRSGYGTRITLVDVSDRSNPLVLRETVVEGWFVNARRIDVDVYTVVDAWMGMPWELWDLVWEEGLDLPVMDWNADEEIQEAIRDEAREILAERVEALVATMDAEDELLPRQVDTIAGQVGITRPLMSCTDLYKPRELTSPSVLSVVHMDMAGSVPTRGVRAPPGQ